MDNRNNFTMLLVVVGVVVCAVLVGTRSEPVQAAVGPDIKPSPMVGLAKGQTARLNVVNLFPPDPCDVSTVFYDSQGKALARDIQKIAPGEASFSELSYAEIGNPNIRVQIRAVVQFSSKDCSAQVLTSLEVYDDETGRTQVFIGDPNQ